MQLHHRIFLDNLFVNIAFLRQGSNFSSPQLINFFEKKWSLVFEIRKYNLKCLDESIIQEI